MINYPRLCGGTFFTLLLQARKQRAKAREHRQGERDRLADTDILIGLIKVLNPDYSEPTATTKNTFKTNTSDYKACKISRSAYLPLDETASFDARVINSYVAPLDAMSRFVDQFIDVGTSSEKDHRLVKALLELICMDQSIPETQGFYIFLDGSIVTKAMLYDIADICLPAFLLGIWHFILTDRKDNAIGKETYDQWCPPRNGAERIYVGTMGSGILHDINLILPDIPDAFDNQDKVEITEDEPSTERSEPFDEDSSTKTINQTVNNPIIFNQYGSNSMQIGNIDTLTITKDWGEPHE